MQIQDEVVIMSDNEEIPADVVPLADAALATGASVNTLRSWANRKPPRITKYLMGGHFNYVSLSEVRREIERMRSIKRAEEKPGE